jgi:hypothetical protein
MHQVKEERIKNEKVRELFGGIDMVCNFVTRRRLNFIGQILRQDDRKLTKKLLTCWIQCARASSGQQSTLKDANFNAINLLLKSNSLKVIKDCPTLSWATEALEPATWRELVTKTKYVRATRKARKDEEHTTSADPQIQVVVRMLSLSPSRAEIQENHDPTETPRAPAPSRPPPSPQNRPKPAIRQ